jgi:hypothetical protein
LEAWGLASEKVLPEKMMIFVVKNLFGWSLGGLCRRLNSEYSYN